MTSRRSPQGFSTPEAIIIILVLAVLAFTGWYIWNKNQSKKPVDSTRNTPSQTQQTEKNTTPDETSGWLKYEQKDLGVKFLYPKTWTTENLRTTETANGEQGWTLTIRPLNPQKGDPGITLSTYPANASIRDVDAGKNDIKIQDITTKDKTTLTLVGFSEDPKVKKSTQMYLSSCWPRNCTPKLANGRLLGVNVGSTNNDCQKGEFCPTEINTGGENYGIFLNILKSIESF